MKLEAPLIVAFCISSTGADEPIKAALATPDTVVISDGSDPVGLKHWISYVILGPSNHPFPIVIFTPERYKPLVREIVTILPQSKYDIISAYTHTRIDQPDCRGRKPAPDVWYTVKIAQRDKGDTRACVLPQAVACDYLLAVSKLDAMHWSRADLEPMTVFMSEVRCNTSSEP